MFSLIVTLVSVALVAALALATIYFGGGAYTSAMASVEASRIRVQGQQLLAANEMFYQDHGVYTDSVQDLVEGKYLKSAPTVQAAVGTAYAETHEWYVPAPGVSLFLIEATKATTCAQVNAKGYGVPGILPTLQESVQYQCFGKQLDELMSVAAKNPEAMRLVAQAPEAPFAPEDVTNAPLPHEDDEIWLVSPKTEVDTGTPTVPDPVLTAAVSGNGEFGAPAAGTAVTRRLNLHNSGNAALTGLRYELLGSNPDLQILVTSCGPSPFDLAQNASCYVDVRWQPSFASGLSGSVLRFTGPFVGGTIDTNLTGAVGGFDAQGAWAAPADMSYGTLLRGTAFNTNPTYSIGPDFRMLNNGTNGPMGVEFVMTGDVEHFRFFGAVKIRRDKAVWESGAAENCATAVSDAVLRCTADDPAGSNPRKDIRPYVQFRPQAVGDFSVTISARSLNGATIPGGSVVLAGRGEYNAEGAWRVSHLSGAAEQPSTLTIAGTTVGATTTRDLFMRNIGTHGVLSSAFQFSGDTEHFRVTHVVKTTQATTPNTGNCMVGGGITATGAANCVTDEIPTVTNAMRTIRLTVEYAPKSVGNHSFVVTPVRAGSGQAPTDSVLPAPLVIQGSGLFDATGQWRDSHRSTGANAISTVAFADLPMGQSSPATEGLAYMHNTGTNGALAVALGLTGDVTHFRIVEVAKASFGTTEVAISCGASAQSASQFSTCTTDLPNGTYRSVKVRVSYEPKAVGTHSVQLVGSSSNGSQMPTALTFSGTSFAANGQAALSSTLVDMGNGIRTGSSYGRLDYVFLSAVDGPITYQRPTLSGTGFALATAGGQAGSCGTGTGTFELAAGESCSIGVYHTGSSARSGTMSVSTSSGSVAAVFQTSESTNARFSGAFSGDTLPQNRVQGANPLSAPGVALTGPMTLATQGLPVGAYTLSLEGDGALFFTRSYLCAGTASCGQGAESLETRQRTLDLTTLSSRTVIGFTVRAEVTAPGAQNLRAYVRVQGVGVDMRLPLTFEVTAP